MKNLDKIVVYLLIAFIVLWSGGLATYDTFNSWPLALIVPIALYSFLRRKFLFSEFSRQHVIVLAIFLLILFFQTVRFGISLSMQAMPFLKLVTCSLIAFIVAPRFREYFPRFIALLALAGLPFWLLDLFPPIHDFFLDFASTLPQFGAERLWTVGEAEQEIINSYTLYLYTVPTGLNPDSMIFDVIVRNCGPFWEPGRYTIYLVLALTINLFNNPEKIVTRENCLLIFANLSTFSTTGYIAMGIALLSTVLLRKHTTVREIVSVAVIFLGIISISQLNFMNDKISSQIADSGNANSRFGAFLYHSFQISQSPLIGYGNSLNDVFVDALLSPCGVTDLARFWGIPGALLFYVLLFLGIKVYVSPQKGQLQYIFTFVILITLAFSQTITMSPFFYTLYFFAFCREKRVRNYKIIWSPPQK